MQRPCGHMMTKRERSYLGQSEAPGSHWFKQWAFRGVVVFIILPFNLGATGPPGNSHSLALVTRHSHVMFPHHSLFFLPLFSYLLQILDCVSPSEKTSLMSQPGKTLLTATLECKLALPDWGLPPSPTTPEMRNCLLMCSLCPQTFTQWLVSISYFILCNGRQMLKEKEEG